MEKHFKKNGDDVLVIKGHLFLDNSSQEKDFIIVNLTKGYIMLLEVKFNGDQFQKAKKQLFDGIAKIQKLFKRLNIDPWDIVGVFYREEGISF